MDFTTTADAVARGVEVLVSDASPPPVAAPASEKTSDPAAASATTDVSQSQSNGHSHSRVVDVAADHFARSEVATSSSDWDGESVSAAEASVAASTSQSLPIAAAESDALSTVCALFTTTNVTDALNATPNGAQAMRSPSAAIAALAYESTSTCGSGGGGRGGLAGAGSSDASAHSGHEGLVLHAKVLHGSDATPTEPEDGAPRCGGDTFVGAPHHSRVVSSGTATVGAVYAALVQSSDCGIASAIAGGQSALPEGTANQFDACPMALADVLERSASNASGAQQRGGSGNSNGKDNANAGTGTGTGSGPPSGDNALLLLSSAFAVDECVTPTLSLALTSSSCGALNGTGVSPTGVPTELRGVGRSCSLSVMASPVGPHASSASGPPLTGNGIQGAATSSSPPPNNTSPAAAADPSADTNEAAAAALPTRSKADVLAAIADARARFDGGDLQALDALTLTPAEKNVVRNEEAYVAFIRLLRRLRTEVKNARYEENQLNRFRRQLAIGVAAAGGAAYDPAAASWGNSVTCTPPKSPSLSISSFHNASGLGWSPSHHPYPMGNMYAPPQPPTHSYPLKLQQQQPQQQQQQPYAAGAGRGGMGRGGRGGPPPPSYPGTSPVPAPFPHSHGAPMPPMPMPPMPMMPTPFGVHPLGSPSLNQPPSGSPTALLTPIPMPQLGFPSPATPPQFAPTTFAPDTSNFAAFGAFYPQMDAMAAGHAHAHAHTAQQHSGLHATGMHFSAPLGTATSPQFSPHHQMPMLMPPAPSDAAAPPPPHFMGMPFHRQ